MQLNKKTKDLFSFLGRIALSLAILYFVFTKIDLEKTGNILKTARVDFIFYAFIVFIICNIILLFRWFIFIRALDLKSPKREVVRYFFVGLFGNLFLPTAIGGDIIKILGLCKDNDQKAKVVASVLLDRLSGYGGVVLVPLVALIFSYRNINAIEVIFMVAILAAGSLTLFFILFNHKVYSFVCQIFNKIPKIKNGLMNLHYNIALLKDKKLAGLKAVLMATLGQAVFASTFILLAKSLNQDINPIYFFVFIPLTCVASLIPSIGGLGVREAGTAYLFYKVGVDAGVAVSMSLINYLFMTIVGLLGGLIYVFTLSSRRIQPDK